MRRGFTLLEVLVATAIAGLTITAAYRLIAMSYSLLADTENDRHLLEGARVIWLRFRTDKDMASSGTDDKLGVKWEAEDKTVKIYDEYDFSYRKVRVTDISGREIDIYVSARVPERDNE